MNTMPLFYSALFISLLSLLSIIFAYLIVTVRKSEQIGIGDGENKMMQRRIRVQANFLEYLLPFALLFIIYELNRGNELILIIIGSSFVIARILHAIGLTKTSGYSVGRFYGTLITWLVILFLSIINLYQII